MEIQLHISDRIPLEEYMQRSQEERQAHLDLSQPCLEIGAGSKGGRALLAVLLGTTAEGLGKGNGYLCHACHNGACSNPYHHYFGTPSENACDVFKDDPDRGARIRDVILSRNPNHYKEMGARSAIKGGGNNRLTSEQIQSRMSQIAHLDPTKWGYVKQVSEIWGVSHTQVRRILDSIPSTEQANGTDC